MFVVLFEVQPHEESWNEYLDIAKLLRPELEAIEGFVDNTRFASARTPGRLLSLSTWRDEKSLIRWRIQATHHDQGQRRGRFEIFADYRLRVAEVTDDTHPPAGVSLRQSRYDETEVGAAKAVTVLEPLDTDSPPAMPELDSAVGLADLERYDGILEPHLPLLLASWTDLVTARGGTPPVDYPDPPPKSHPRIRPTRTPRSPQYFPNAT